MWHLDVAVGIAMALKADENMHDLGADDPWCAGRYDLVAVLTHKGRSADSGHYVSWVKEEDGQWINFDDELIIAVKEADVLALAGGGDWHMANLLLYRAQVVPAE